MCEEHKKREGSEKGDNHFTGFDWWLLLTLDAFRLSLFFLKTSITLHFGVIGSLLFICIKPGLSEGLKRLIGRIILTTFNGAQSVSVQT